MRTKSIVWLSTNPEGVERGLRQEHNLGVGGDSDDETDSSLQGINNFLVSPNWLPVSTLDKGLIEFEGEIFWKGFVSVYLDPIDKDETRDVLCNYFDFYYTNLPTCGNNFSEKYHYE
jgi:hypothetical protein